MCLGYLILLQIQISLYIFLDDLYFVDPTSNLIFSFKDPKCLRMPISVAFILVKFGASEIERENTCLLRPCLIKSMYDNLGFDYGNLLFCTIEAVDPVMYAKTF